MKRLTAIMASQAFLAKYFPDCNGAFLAGSVVQGRATATSDLDIVVIDNTVQQSYCKSFVEFGWPIEVFVYNLSGYQKFCTSDCLRARPTLPRMVADGRILKGNQELEQLKIEAQLLLAQGPVSWTKAEQSTKRYFLSDCLEDFSGATDLAEERMIVAHLAKLAHEFILRTNQHWVGSSKWIIRELRNFDPVTATEFSSVLERYYQFNEKQPLVQFVDAILLPFVCWL